MADEPAEPAEAARDLVVIALPGVQRFIGEARSTGDVRAASEIVATLASVAAVACQAAGGELIFPSSLAAGADSGDAVPGGEPAASSEASRDGMPNRVVVLAPTGLGGDVAGRAKSAVEAAWESWVRQAMELAGPDKGGPPTPATPGFPAVQWVCVPALPGGYPAQWARAHDLLDARRRVRDFSGVSSSQRALCSLSPRWPAETPPKGVKKHEEDTLSAANWVKRRWRWIHKLDGFASTSSIASAGYRRDVAAHLDDPDVAEAVGGLMAAAREVRDDRETPVPGLPVFRSDPGLWLVRSAGPWVYEDRWQATPLARETRKDPGVLRPVVFRGAAAAKRLAEIMKTAYGVPPPASYLAVMVQDLDGMGLYLSGLAASATGGRLGVSPQAHAGVSESLRGLAALQRQRLKDSDLLGVPVYAGGDDLLAFVPAASALAAAQACHDLIPGDLPRASTAVLFFHYHAGLQTAMSLARLLLDQAKEAVPRKHALTVGYVRRSGASEFSIQRWDATALPGPGGSTGAGSTAESLRLFAADRAHPLSPRLVADLERDASELASLSGREPAIYRAEIARLVGRHIGKAADQEPDGTPVGGGQVRAAGSAAARSAAAREAADALLRLGQQEYAPRGPSYPDGPRPALAARIGVFLRQEAR
ncbi:MAG TPA: type III-B CRISPR-associated protein Cas10/Cmr2 [Streptosporangiaceae bacterium]|nr:type III-B CRISPR-associated protein Cas10/Cmr2 [Streptosporangiaceae bacterium]